MAIYSFELFKAHHNEGAPLPRDLEIGMTCRDIDCALNDFERLITRSITKDEAIELITTLADYEARIASLLNFGLRKAESFDFPRNAA